MISVDQGRGYLELDQSIDTLDKAMAVIERILKQEKLTINCSSAVAVSVLDEIKPKSIQGSETLWMKFLAYGAYRTEN